MSFKQNEHEYGLFGYDVCSKKLMRISIPHLMISIYMYMLQFDSVSQNGDVHVMYIVFYVHVPCNGTTHIVIMNDEISILRLTPLYYAWTPCQSFLCPLQISFLKNNWNANQATHRSKIYITIYRYNQYNMFIC